MALACSAPPEGCARWTRKLLAGRRGAGEVGESLAEETRRKTREKESQPGRKPSWGMPPSRSAPCGATREEGRDTYQRDLAAGEGLVCREEPHRPLPAPRCLACAPDENGRPGHVPARRPARDGAQCSRALAAAPVPAKQLVLILAHWSPPRGASRSAAVAPTEARQGH